MKETTRTKNNGGKPPKKAADPSKRTSPARKKTPSGDGLLGLETNLYIYKQLLEAGSLERALQSISDYILDLFDLNVCLIFMEDHTGERLMVSAASARRDIIGYLRGLNYRFGSSRFIDNWLGGIFNSDGPVTLGRGELDEMLVRLTGEGVITEEAFGVFGKTIKDQEKLNLLSYGRNKLDEDPFLVLNVAGERAFSNTEKKLLGKIADNIALAASRRLEIYSLDRKLTRYKALVDSKEHAYFLLIDGVLEFFSGQLSEILGVKSSELVGRKLEDFLHPDDARDLEKMLSAFLSNAGGSAKKYYHIYRLLGTGDEVEMQIHLIDFRGRPAIRGTIENVTQRSMLEKTAMESKHLESLAKLAGGVAHDFNNLIGAMVGYSSLVRNSMPEGDERVGQLKKIEEAGKRANKLTRQLLSMSRKGKYALEAVNIGDVLDQATKGCLIPMDHISVTKNCSAIDLNVEGDPTQLYEALLNIFMNAREAMPSGGMIDISIQNGYVDQTHRVFADGMKTGEYIEISVKDRGEGMDPTVLRKAPEPFYTTKQDRTHKGLGLPATIGIIEGHKGKIDMSSRPGEGTEIVVYLPVTDKTQKDSTQLNVPGSDSCRVLIIDDEDIILDLVSDMLTRLGYDTVVAESGIRALEIIKEEQVDLVFLDLLMPEMSGQETFYKIQELDADLPIIISSGYSEDSVIRDLLNDGAISFLRKPYRLKDMTSIMRSATGVIGSSSGKGG